MPRPFRACLAALLLLSAASAQPVDVYPARDAVLSLNGTWQFKYAAGTEAQFDDNSAGYAPITVPGLSRSVMSKVAGL